MCVSYGLEVGVKHCIFWSDSLGVVVPEHLAQQVKSFIRYEVVVLGIDEFVPGLAWLRSDKIVVMIVQSEPILVNIGKEVFGSQNLGDLHKLIIVVASLEEWLLLEDHSSEHASE